MSAPPVPHVCYEKKKHKQTSKRLRYLLISLLLGVHSGWEYTNHVSVSVFYTLCTSGLVSLANVYLLV